MLKGFFIAAYQVGKGIGIGIDGIVIAQGHAANGQVVKVEEEAFGVGCFQHPVGEQFGGAREFVSRVVVSTIGKVGKSVAGKASVGPDKSCKVRAVDQPVVCPEFDSRVVGSPGIDAHVFILSGSLCYEQVLDFHVVE